MAAIAKIPRYELRFENELSSAAGAAVIKRVSAGDTVNHRILGYYGRPTSSADILIDFECAHPNRGPAKYQNDDGQLDRRWNGKLQVDGAIRRASATPILRKLVVTAPPAPVGAVIMCSFKVKKRWSRELSSWEPVAPGHFETRCKLTYRIRP